jgi:interferon, gamma-inducible protein 30
MYLLLPLVLCQ